jgi:hypothetical protein
MKYCKDGQVKEYEKHEDFIMLMEIINVYKLLIIQLEVDIKMDIKGLGWTVRIMDSVDSG